MITRDRALVILSECTGDDIWSVQHCQSRHVPEAWIDEMADAHESGFQNASQTIHLPGPSPHHGQPDARVTNQYFGVHDLKLAMRIGTTLGIDVDRVVATSFTRRQAVDAIKRAIEEG